MPTSHGRHCRRCRVRISRKMRLCPVCGAVNLKALDYVLLAAAAIISAVLAGRWW
jgi:hypothetical protein